MHLFHFETNISINVFSHFFYCLSFSLFILKHCLEEFLSTESILVVMFEGLVLTLSVYFDELLYYGDLNMPTLVVKWRRQIQTQRQTDEHTHAHTYVHICIRHAYFSFHQPYLLIILSSARGYSRKNTCPRMPRNRIEFGAMWSRSKLGFMFN